MTSRRIGSAALALAALVALAARPARADATVSAAADRATVGAEDTFEVTVSVGGGADAELRAPAMRDFRIVSQSRGTEMTMENGRAPVTSERFVLGVRPLRTGRLTFPPLEVVADGRTTATAPLPIEVVPSHAAVPARAAADPFATFGAGADPFDDDVGDLFRRMQSELQPTPSKNDVLVRASVDDPHPYVGQQTTLSIHLLTRVPLGSVQLSRMPSVAGATAEDLPTSRQPSPTLVDVHGVRYQSFLLARKALFPLRAGTIEVPPIEIAADVGGFRGGTRLTPATEPVRLAARRLPAGGPTDEAVGRWTLATSVAPARAVAGEPLTVRVVAEGVGDLHALALPAPTLPRGWRSYAPTVRDVPRSDGGRLGGARIVETVVVPDRAGRAVLGVPPLAYFDPGRRHHELARSAPVVVEVAPAPPASVASAASGSATPTKSATRAWPATRQLLRAVATSVGAIALLAVAVWLGGALLRRARVRPPSARARLRRARRHLHLAAALRARGRSEQFYDELARALRDTIDSAAPMVTAAPPARLEQHLTIAGVPADTRAALLAAVDACNLGRFAHAGDGAAAMANAWALARAAVAAVTCSPLPRPGARSSLA